jgi:hypothetical protein
MELFCSLGTAGAAGGDAAAVGRGSSGDEFVRVRSYTVSITYDKYYQVITCFVCLSTGTNECYEGWQRAVIRPVVFAAWEVQLEQQLNHGLLLFTIDDRLFHAFRSKGAGQFRDVGLVQVQRFRVHGRPRRGDRSRERKLTDRACHRVDGRCRGCGSSATTRTGLPSAPPRSAHRMASAAPRGSGGGRGAVSLASARRFSSLHNLSGTPES